MHSLYDVARVAELGCRIQALPNVSHAVTALVGDYRKTVHARAQSDRLRFAKLEWRM